MDTLWRGLADAVAGVHYAFMAFLVVGGFVGLALAEGHLGARACCRLGGR